MSFQAPAKKYARVPIVGPAAPAGLRPTWFVGVQEFTSLQEMGAEEWQGAMEGRKGQFALSSGTVRVRNGDVDGDDTEGGCDAMPGADTEGDEMTRGERTRRRHRNSQR